MKSKKAVFLITTAAHHLLPYNFKPRSSINSFNIFSSYVVSHTKRLIRSYEIKKFNSILSLRIHDDSQVY